MDILDGKSHDKAGLQSHLDRTVYFLNGGKWWGLLDAPGVIQNYRPEDLKRGDALFLTSLRALVNQWIDSGKDGDGIEAPLKRDINVVPPGYVGPLFDVMLGWLNRNPPKPALMRSGKIAILDRQPSPWMTDDENVVRYRDPEDYARECAVSYLKELLDLPGAHRLARCNNPKCGRYYLRLRLRKKEIKRGAYCGSCVGIGSRERTRISRDNCKRELIELAASVWPTTNWKPTHKYSSQTDWVLAQMKKKKPAMQITSKWISQNKKAIEIVVQRQTAAGSLV